LDSKRQTLHLRTVEGRWYFAADRNGGCVMGIDKFNHEGYHDPTPHKALTNIIRKKKAEKKSAFKPLVYIFLPIP
jgi:hypothetical protein